MIGSLKGKLATWSGLVETTDIAPSAGAFGVLEDCVISRDGTEIHPAPGTRLCGKPFYGQSVVVTTVSVGVSVTTLTLNATAEQNTNSYLPSTVKIYVPADDAVYTMTRTGANTGTIPTITSLIANSDKIQIQRKKSVHDMGVADKRAAIVLETKIYQSVSTEVNNLATMVCSGPLSIDAPPGPGIPDETDAGFVMWPTPTAFPYNLAEVGHDVSYARKLRHYDIVRRMQCDTTNGRLLIAVPGLGIMFEANVRRATQWMPRGTTTAANQPDPRYTKMLGIPRGLMPNSAASNAGGGGALLAGYYAFAVGYYDPYSMEIGLLSPVQVVQAANADTGGPTGHNQIDVYPARARAAAYECLGLQSVAYLDGPYTTVAEARQSTVQPYYTVGPLKKTDDIGAFNASLAAYCDKISFVTLLSNLLPIRPNRYGVLEEPPPGASWVRVVRNHMFCGAERPTYWDFDAWPVQATIDGITNYFLVLPHEWQVDTPLFGPMSWGKIPASFAGRIVAEIESSAVANMGSIVSIHNGVTGGITTDLPDGSQTGPTTLKIDFNAGTTASFITGNLKHYRVLSRPSAVKYGEEDNPASSNSDNELPIDSSIDVTTSGGARLGDSLLLFTPRETSLFSWASMPRSAAKQTVSNTHGSVSAHGIIEGPFGAAWLSHDGPMRWLGGGTEWIGAAIETTWATVFRDSEGMAICNGAAIDTARSLVMWGVRTQTGSDWTAATTDELKSKVACDTLLVWNYATNAWSVVRREGVQMFESVKTMLLDDGTMRPVFASASTTLADDVYCPLYAFESVCDRQDPIESNVTAERDPGSQDVETDDDATTVDAGDYALIRSADGSVCRWFGASGGATGSGMTCGAAAADVYGAEWHVGDVLVAPCVRMQMATLRMSNSPDGSETAEFGVYIQADLECDNAYAKITATDQDGTEHVLTEPWGMRLNNGWTNTTRRVSGNDLVISIEVVADGFLAIKDIRHGIG